MPDAPPPPRPRRRPTVLRHHGDERVDEWYWLRERDDPEVIAYLEAENAYMRAATAHTEALRQKLYDEIVGRIQETDVSAPVPHGPYQYYSRTIEGSQYVVHCRRLRDVVGLPDALAAPGTPADEEVILDENVLAGDHGFLELGGIAASPDHSLLAYSCDFTGDERYELRVRDLATGDDLPDVVPDVYYGLAWANDNRTVFFTRPDPAMRPWQVWRHTLGRPAGDDALVYQEDDQRFNVGVGRSRTGRLLVLPTASRVTSEIRVLDSDDPTGPLQLVEPRAQGVEYAVEHHHSSEHGDRLFVLTSADGAENFKLMVAPITSPGRDSWREVIPHRDDVRLEEVDAFAGHLVLSERGDALARLRVRRLADGAEHLVEMPEPVYTSWLGTNHAFETAVVRFGYTSLATPPSDYSYDLERRAATLLKRQPVRGYDPAGYETGRLWAKAGDGAEIPISLVHRRGLARDGGAPLLLYGYGSYEASMDPAFSSARLCLLERGFVWATAHVRGGGELGRRWYEDGKLERKPHTFADFITCAEHLIGEGYTSAPRLVARSGSAGGLLMGAVANARPDLFRAIVAEVPFVDCLTTILDESLPLTVNEWEEWGNPVADPGIYALMKSYTPYDNVRAQAYPAMLVTAGLHDSRVQYWEPAKWVAKLRASKTDDNLLLLKTELGAGHSGPSGRYDAWRDEAFVLAFVLDQVGISD